MRTMLIALVASTGGCGLYFGDETATDGGGELELASARNQALPDTWADMVGMTFETEPLTWTWVEYGTPRSLPLPAPTALRFDGQDGGAALELAGMFMSVFEGDCVIANGGICSGSTCFGEVEQRSEGICAFVFSGARLDGGETAERCFTVARFYGGTERTEADRAFIAAHNELAIAARARCDDAIAR